MDETFKENRDTYSFDYKNKVKSLPNKNVNAPSASSFAEMHIPYRYSVFDEICSGVEVCRPHPTQAGKLGSQRTQNILQRTAHARCRAREQ